MSVACGSSRFAKFIRQGRVPLLLCTVLALPFAAHAQQPQPETPQQPVPSTPVPDAPQTPAQSNTAPVPATAPAPDTAQAPAPATPAADPAQTPGAAEQQAGSAAAPIAAQPAPPPQYSQAGAITEEELKQMLQGKQLYLRGGYLGDNLTFDERGRIVGHPAKGSYTLSILQIDHVRLTKHKVEIEGARYGLHFNEQLAYEDSSTAYDKVRITPKKKVVRMTIDRELVVTPKKKKEPVKERASALKSALSAVPADSGTHVASGIAAPAASAPPAETPGAEHAAAPGPGTPSPTAEQAQTPSGIAPASGNSELSDADQLKASIAATPEAERPADPSSVTTTTSQAHANQVLRDALDATLAPSLDERMMAAMPDFWKFYYQSVAAKRDYRPADASVLRQSTVDQKAQLLTSFEPDSNDFAQAAGVAGMALYHTVIGSDGKAGEIAVARPIGFGLDENAVAAIRKAKFSPAMKDGKPVPVMLDLVVQFRIFSKRTAATAGAETADKDKASEPMLPGPYSVPHPN